MTKIKWIPIKEKPKESCTVYIMNERGGEGAFVALYDAHNDVFKLYDPKMYNHPCLDVTHWYPLPDSFVRD